MDKARIGIVGSGRLGGFHASKAANNPEAELVGIFDVSEENRKRVAAEHGVRDFESLDELLAEVDAVVVATPSVLHAEVGRRVLNAGKHLLVEKPATTDGRSARHLAELARSKGLVMQVGHVEEYNPGWRVALDELDDVRKGESPVMIDATRTSGYTFRSTDVGATLDLMIHDLELVLGLVRAPLARVSASGYAQLGGLEDAAFANLEFMDGSIARLNASRVEQTAVRQMTLRTARKTVAVDFAARSATVTTPNDAVVEGRYAPTVVSFSEMAPRVKTFMQEEFTTRTFENPQIDALALEMADFLSAILRGTPSTVPGERAAYAVEVAEMIVDDLEERARRSRNYNRRLRIAG